MLVERYLDDRQGTVVEATCTRCEHSVVSWLRFLSCPRCTKGYIYG
jgi:hypothetical protein